MFGIDIAAFFAKPIVKYGGPVLLVVLAYFAFQWWLGAHDRAVRAEYLIALREQARKDSEKAAASASAKQEIRDEAFNKSQANLANATDVDDWAERLRAEQCRAGKIAAPC